MEERLTYIQVLAPVKLDWMPWYIATWDAKVGQRVEVRLKAAKYVGVIVKVAQNTDIGNNVRIIRATKAEGIRDISLKEIEFWRFLSKYYMCTLGEIYKLAYPLLLTTTEQTGAAILERLHKRLAIREEALKKKHNQTVTERLLKERDAILKEIAAAGGATIQEKPAAKTAAQKTPVLLFGAERLSAYIDLITAAIQQGHSALLLEPEYDFTSAIGEKLEELYPDRVLSYNSRMTPKKRRLCLERLTGENAAHIVVGTKQAVFLPFTNLGLVIVDAEQDISYKRADSFPKINFRDAGAALAAIHGADLVLGSDAPSLETVYNCKSGKYNLKKLNSKDKTEVELIDIPKEKAKNGMVGMFSRKAIKQIKADQDKLITVIRGYEKPEDVYAELQKIVPGKDPQILHAISARKSLSHSDLMIILQADSLFSRTDFRADEKAFALLSALKSRCDRLLIQSSNTQHPILQAVANDATKELYDSLMKERQDFNLPPFTRLVDVITKDGTLIRREVLNKDKELSAKKENLYRYYKNGFAFDVDPIQ